MIYWSLQQTAKFNNKACLVLHLIAAASNIWNSRREAGNPSTRCILWGVFLSSVHTLWRFCFFPVCLILTTIIRFVTHYIKMSRGSSWWLYVTILNIIYPQTEQLSLIHINLKNESNLVFLIHFLKICSLPALTPLGLQMNLSYTAWSILIKSATLIRGGPFPDAGQWCSF